MSSLWVEEPVHTSWSRCCNVNHWASNYQLSNMKCLGRDLNWRPQRLKAHSNCYSTEPPDTACNVIGALDKLAIMNGNTQGATYSANHYIESCSDEAAFLAENALVSTLGYCNSF